MWPTSRSPAASRLCRGKADLAQPGGEPALPREGRQLLEDARGRRAAGRGRRDEPSELGPGGLDQLGPDLSRDQRRQRRPPVAVAGYQEPLVGQVADPRGEAEAQERAQAEDVVGEAARVGVVLLDPQRGPVPQETVEHVRRLVRRGGDHLGMEGAELVGDVAVEADARLLAVPGVGGGGRPAQAAGLEELAVGRRSRAVAPQPGQRRLTLRLDQARGRERVRVLADVPVDDPGELPDGDPPARLGHAPQAEVDAVRQHAPPSAAKRGRPPAARSSGA